MDDFAALQKLKGLSVSKAADKKDSKPAVGSEGSVAGGKSALRTSSYAVAGAKASAVDEDADGKATTGESYNYYDNSYQRYMAEHGGLEDGGDECDDGEDTRRDDDDDGSGSASLSPPRVRKDPTLGLDLSSLKGGEAGSHMSPQHAAFNVLDHDPFARFREKEQVSPPAPLKPIGSVGQIKKAYRERERHQEREQQKRHAKHVVKVAQNVSSATTAIYSDPYGNTRPGRKITKTERSRTSNNSSRGQMQISALEFGGSTVSALSFGEYGGEGFPMLGGGLDGDSIGSISQAGHLGQADGGAGVDSDSVLIDNLDYTTFSCDSSLRNDLLERIKRILQSGSQVLLQSVQEGDVLDCKMLLKTLSSHMAMYTENGFMPAEIRRNIEGCLQMQLCPKGMVM